MQVVSRQTLRLTATILLAVFLLGCGILGGDSKIGEGVVIAPRLKIRSSTAMVALDLAEVKRGERVEILDHAEVKTPTQVQEWYRVRTKGKDQVIGWVESRDVVNQDVVDKTEELF